MQGCMPSIGGKELPVVKLSMIVVLWILGLILLFFVKQLEKGVRGNEAGCWLFGVTKSFYSFLVNVSFIRIKIVCWIYWLFTQIVYFFGFNMQCAKLRNPYFFQQADKKSKGYLYFSFISMWLSKGQKATFLLKTPDN